MKIVISGTTGVGKSTIINLLKKYYEEQGKEVYLLGELVVDSPYFDLFFNENIEWGLLGQLDFLFQRFEQYVKFEKKYEENPNIIILYDRHFLEDKIFSEMAQVTKNNSTMMKNVFSNVYSELLNKIDLFEKPDFLILLKASFDTIEYRMNKRNRGAELMFETKYWQDLYYRYYAKASHRERFIKYSKNFVEMDANDDNPEIVVNKIIKYVVNKKRK